MFLEQSKEDLAILPAVACVCVCVCVCVRARTYMCMLKVIILLNMQVSALRCRERGTQSRL